MDCSQSGSSVYGILQARLQEWVAIYFSRRSSQSRDRTQVSCIAGRFFTIWATREAQEYWNGLPFTPPEDLPIPGIKPTSHVSCIGWQFLFFSFNWRIITLQYCAGFCHTSMWITHGCTCPPSWSPLPPPSPTASLGLSQRTGFERPASRIKLALVTFHTW